MRNLFLLVTFIVTLAAIPLEKAVAQNRPGTTIALLDIEEVFQNYTRYKSMLEDVRVDEKALETLVRGKAKELSSLQSELRDYKPGSADYAQLEGRIAKLKADTTVETDLKRKEFIIHAERDMSDGRSEAPPFCPPPEKKTKTSGLLPPEGKT